MLLKNKEKFVPQAGVTYKGEFWFNEYGEFGCNITDPNAPKCSAAFRTIHKTDGCTIQESKNYWKLTLSIAKNATFAELWRLVETSVTKLSYYTKKAAK